jgi:fucose permease
MGLLTDTHIQTNQFSELALAFYVTYLVFELPTGYLMQRFPTAKYLGLNGNMVDCLMNRFTIRLMTCK